ncbi:MAG: DUF2953 domain-containing protein [Clostridia bacterium]|nr:DUF2953 domain-containing protein [Clostridia bacterium]
MIVLWIILAIIAAIALLILLGGIRIRIIAREKVKVQAVICGIRITLVSDKEKKKKEPKPLARCRNPEAVLRREQRRQQKAARAAEKKRQKALKKAEKKAARKRQHAAAKSMQPSPNLKENLDMILALLKKLYETTRGKVRVRIRRMHIRVGTDDAAKTAILYGVILQSVSCILGFIEEKFTHLSYRDGEISLSPDYVSGHTAADIDIAVSIKIRRILRIGIAMLLTFLKEHDVAKEKARLRVQNNGDSAAQPEK